MNKTLFEEVTAFIRKIHHKPDGFIPLHEPRFTGNEEKYVLDCLHSTFVSSVGKYVDLFEQMTAEFTGAKYAVATTNGTSALHMALKLAGVESGDLVITQSLTFIATCNAISYAGAEPVFIDIDKDTLGLSPEKVKTWLEETCGIRGQATYHIDSGKRIAACLPMHTFGLPMNIEGLLEVCDNWSVPVVEDAAESLGSYRHDRHTGTSGLLGTLSFNGNKTITCGGGGMILTNDENLAKRAKHLTTQAKLPHRWEYVHDEIGYNYRLPNLNAALACAQMEQLPKFIEDKRELAAAYKELFDHTSIAFISEPKETRSNYWLNAILLKDFEEREEFLSYTNDHKVMTRPVWRLMHHLPMFSNAHKGDLSTSEEVEKRLVNIPSSVRVN